MGHLLLMAIILKILSGRVLDNRAYVVLGAPLVHR